MDNLEEMDIFLEKKQEETEITNKWIRNTESDKKKKNLPQNKNPGPTGFTGELYQTFRDELMPFLLKCFQKISEGETLPNSFYKAQSPWCQNQEKATRKKKITG